MIRIRDAHEGDLPKMLAIYNHVIVHTTAVYTYQPHTLEMRAQWFAGRQQDGLPVFVAEWDGKVAGFSSYGPFRAWPAYKYTVENSVYVAEEFRGKGIAKALIKPLIERAEATGMHAIIAGIDATNDASIRLHQAFGFVEVAHFKEVGYKFGRWLDLKFLELVLDGPKHPKEE